MISTTFDDSVRFMGDATGYDDIVHPVCGIVWKGYIHNDGYQNSDDFFLVYRHQESVIVEAFPGGEGVDKPKWVSTITEILRRDFDLGTELLMRFEQLEASKPGLWVRAGGHCGDESMLELYKLWDGITPMKEHLWNFRGRIRGKKFGI